MKKCASCTKDLPDAALHCVFCGAKQPPASAVQQAMAKTAFGYTGNEGRPQPGFPQPPLATAPTMMPPPPSHAPLATAQTAVPPPPSRAPMAMAATQAVPAYPGGSLAPSGQPQAPFKPPPGPATIPAPSAYGPSTGGKTIPAPSAYPSPPQPPPQAPFQPPPFQPPPFQPPPQATIPAPSPSGLAPASNAGAATLFVQGPGPAPQGSFGRSAPMQPTMVPQPLQPMALPAAPAPQMPQPMAIPAAMGNAYQTSPTATNVRRPIDPWRDSLRAMMFIWGFLLIVAFATPVALKPELAFMWTGLLDNLGTASLPRLTIAAVGVLALVLAFVPMPTPARGVLATVLGLAGIAVPIALVGVPPWQAIVPLVGAMLLLPGLVIRSEYLAALLPRILVTLGVAGLLLHHLMPSNDTIPLVALFKALIEAPGSAKVGPALELGLIVIIVMALLAWLPSPATGGAKLWAWLFILWPLVTHVVEMVVKGGLGDRITGSPNEALVAWIAMGPAYMVLIAYGLAAAFGKQLE